MSSDSLKLQLDELDTRIRDFACHGCPLAGRCERFPLGDCPISLHLPALLPIVASIHSNRMDVYVSKLRRHICSNCPGSDQGSGICSLREKGYCALDTYFLPIVTTIEDWLASPPPAASAA